MATDLYSLAQRVAYRLLPLYYTKRKFEAYSSKMLAIPDCRDTLLAVKYSRGQLTSISAPLTEYCDRLFELITDKVALKTPYSIIRGGDGDGYFLLRQAVGNIPLRQYTKEKDLSNVDLSPFRDGFLKCDLRLVEIYRPNQELFMSVYGQNVFSEIPVECVYALIASRRLLRTSWKIGLIGNDHLLPIIKRLLEHQAYRDYIGRSSFQDYIPVPQRGAANDPVALTAEITKRLSPTIDLYLVGMGSAKMPILHRLTEGSNAVFLDVGVCMQAIAGVVNRKRAYFAEWRNFRLRDFDYSVIDTMGADMRPDQGTPL